MQLKLHHNHSTSATQAPINNASSVIDDSHSCLGKWPAQKVTPANQQLGRQNVRLRSIEVNMMSHTVENTNFLHQRSLALNTLGSCTVLQLASHTIT
jgi:hypothetical protein